MGVLFFLLKLYPVSKDEGYSSRDDVPPRPDRLMTDR